MTTSLRGALPVVDAQREDLIPVELDARVDDGVEVSLLWRRRTDTLAVFVNDTRSGETFAIEVESTYALDAFHHPYAYAAARGVEYGHHHPVRV
jgi:hypothetical protein